MWQCDLEWRLYGAVQTEDYHSFQKACLGAGNFWTAKSKFESDVARATLSRIRTNVRGEEANDLPSGNTVCGADPHIQGLSIYKNFNQKTQRKNWDLSLGDPSALHWSAFEETTWFSCNRHVHKKKLIQTTNWFKIDAVPYHAWNSIYLYYIKLDLVSKKRRAPSLLSDIM